MSKKLTKPQPRYIIISYGPSEWAVVDAPHCNVIAKCAFLQDAKEIVWHLTNTK